MFCRQCGNPISDEAAFCSKCGTPTVQTPFVLGTNKNMIQQRKINIGKVVSGILFTILCGWIVFAIIAFIGSFFLKDYINSTFGFVIDSALFFGSLLSIPDIIVIIRRALDPEDAAYELGGIQDEETNKKFENKHKKLQSIMSDIIVAMIVIYGFYAFGVELYRQYPNEIDEILDLFRDDMSDSLYTGTKNSLDLRYEIIQERGIPTAIHFRSDR